MPIDPSKLATAMAKKAEDRENKALDRVGEIANQLGLLLDANSNHPFVKGIEIKLGLVEGEDAKAAELLDFKLADDTTASAPAQQSSSGGLSMFSNNTITVYHADGSTEQLTIGDPASEARAQVLHSMGYAQAIDANTSRPIIVAPKPGSTVDNDDRKLPVYDKDDKKDTGDELSYKRGVNDAEHFEYRPAVSGKPERFIKKSLVRFGR